MSDPCSVLARPPTPLRSAVVAILILLVDLCAGRAGAAVHISFDFTKDTSGFFSDQGRRDVLQAAANQMTDRLVDDLAAIPPPTATNSWQAMFTNPGTGAVESVSNLVVPANTIIIFVGGRSLAGQPERGIETSSFSWSGDTAWRDTIERRGQAPGQVGPWGGSITFDSSYSNWFFGIDPGGIGSGQLDFYTVAEHEIGHLLGFVHGMPASIWDGKVSGTSFTGAAAVGLYGQAVPVEPVNQGHWKDGTTFKGGPLTMDPSADSGRRTQFTELDFAAFQDIGWEIGNGAPLPPGDPGSAAPHSGLVDIQEIADVSPPAGFVVNTSNTAESGGKLFRAGVDGTQHVFVEVSTDNGATWGGRETLGYTTDHAPALVSDEGALVLAVAGQDHHLYLDLKSDPYFKPAWGPVPGGADPFFDTLRQSDSSPTLTHFNDRTYVGWTGTDASMHLAAITFIGRLEEQLQSLPLVNGVLTLEGDQRAAEFDDVITLDRSQTGGVRVKLNSDVQAFAPGAVTGILINTGLGENTVHLKATFPEALITINGGGTDDLIVEAGLPAPVYTPDSTGLPGYGTLDFGGGAMVDFAAIEFVHGVAPQITGKQVDPTDEDGVVTFTGTFTDPGTFSTHSLAIDWGDGSSEPAADLVLGARSWAVSHRYLDDDPTGTPSDLNTISVTITDDDDLTATGTTSIAVSNVAPVTTSVTGSSPSSTPAREGAPVTLSGEFTDVGTLDTHTARVDWGDGAVTSAQITEAGGVGTFQAEHSFSSGGIYTVTVTVTDDDTGRGSAVVTMFVTGVGVQQINGKRTLVAVGSASDDSLAINQAMGKFVVHASFLSSDRRIPVAGIQLIEVVLLAGNDRCTVSSSIALPSVVDGGLGHDFLVGGGGPNILIGGAGDDNLGGGGRRNLLIGGSDADRLGGNGSDDILIAGYTSYDSGPDSSKLANDAILMKIGDEWNSARSYVQRIVNLRAGAGPILGASGASLSKGTTVIDDSFFDKLTGSSGSDWFLFDPAGDLVTDLSSKEIVN